MNKMYTLSITDFHGNLTDVHNFMRKEISRQIELHFKVDKTLFLKMGI